MFTEYVLKHSVYFTKCSSALPNATKHQSPADIHCRFSHFTLFIWGISLVHIFATALYVSCLFHTFLIDLILSRAATAYGNVHERTWHMFSFSFFLHEQEGQLRIVHRTEQTYIHFVRVFRINKIRFSIYYQEWITVQLKFKWINNVCKYLNDSICKVIRLNRKKKWVWDSKWKKIAEDK